MAEADGRPVQLIQIDDEGKCHLQEEACAIIRECTGRLAIVGIAGLYRTGKSFLLNRLLGRQSGFEVGPTVNPCTKGIWMWGRPVQIAPNYHCLFIDTEGLGSAQRTTSCDMQIFSLCILLSSYFIYNSMGAIDEQAIQDLHLVLNIARHIHVRSGGAGDVQELPYYFPTFLWVLRDFHLKLTDRHGSTITPRDYLEDALEPIPGEDAKSSVRGAIRDLFSQRDCMTLIRPVVDEADLRRVEKVPYESLRPEFRTQVEGFVNKVYAALKPKEIKGSQVSGPTFVTLAEEYCKAINDSAVPAIQSAWSAAVQHQLRNSLKDAVTEFTRQVEGDVLQHLPIPETQLQDRLRAAEAEAVRIFNEPGFDEGDPSFIEYREELASRLVQMRHRAEEDNAEASRRQCRAVAEELYEQMVLDRLTSRGSYTSFDQLAGDWSRLRSEFLQRTAGPAQADVLASYLMEKMTESMQRVHDQLRGVSDQRCDTLQLEHAEALEQERHQLQSSLHEAKLQWMQEREDLERRLETMGEDGGTGGKFGRQEEDEATPWRRTRPLEPCLKESYRTPSTATPVGSSGPLVLVPKGRQEPNILPTRSMEGRPSAKQRSRGTARPSVDEDSRSFTTEILGSTSTQPVTEPLGHRSSDVSSHMSMGTIYPDWSYHPQYPEWSSSMTVPISGSAVKALGKELPNTLRPPVPVKSSGPSQRVEPMLTYTRQELQGPMVTDPAMDEDRDFNPDMSSPDAPHTGCGGPCSQQ